MNSLKKLSTIVVFFLVLSAVGPIRQQQVHGNEEQVRVLEHDVRAFGAKGDGEEEDSIGRRALDAGLAEQDNGNGKVKPPRLNN